MFHAYIDSMYLTWLRGKSIEELTDVLKLLVEVLETKHKCAVIGVLDIRLPEDKEKEDGGY